MEKFDDARLMERVWAAVRGEPSVDLRRDFVQGSVDRATATLDGRVGNIAVKKHILKRIAALPELTDLVDHLQVIPSRRMDDGELSAQVRGALSREPTLARCTVQELGAGGCETVLKFANPCGTIVVGVCGGVVTLDGSVPGLVHKQLAGVLA